MKTHHLPAVCAWGWGIAAMAAEAPASTAPLHVTLCIPRYTRTQVIRAILSEDSPSQETLLTSVRRPVSVSKTGYLLYRTEPDQWRLRDVFDWANSERELHAPEATQSGTPSPSGDKVVWLTTQRKGTQALVLDDLQTGRREALVSEEGRIVAQPSWSPDSTRVAYYHWPQDKPDAYRLAVISVGAPGARPVDLAPPPDSVYFDERYLPPRWSPDGRLILFDAAYKATLPRVYHIVDVGTGRISPSTGGMWYEDGEHLLITTYFASSFVSGSSSEYVLANVHTGKTKPWPVPLPEEALDPQRGEPDVLRALCPQARHWLYATARNEVFLIDIRTGAKAKILERGEADLVDAYCIERRQPTSE